MLWHRQVIFESKGDKLSSSAECRIRTQGLRHLIASRLNAHWQTDWAIEDQAKKFELDSPSLWWVNIQPTWPHCQLAFAPGFGDIHVCCCWFRCSGTGKRYSNRKETICLPLPNAGFEPKVSVDCQWTSKGAACLCSPSPQAFLETPGRSFLSLAGHCQP